MGARRAAAGQSRAGETVEESMRLERGGGGGTPLFAPRPTRWVCSTTEQAGRRKCKCARAGLAARGNTVTIP